MAVKADWQDGEQFSAADANAVAAAVNAAQVASEKGQPSGFASLDETGKVPAEELPIQAPEVSLDGAESLSNKTLVSPVVDAPAGADSMVVKVDGATAFTFNQYGEFFGNSGHGLYYDSNISASGFSSTGQLNLTSGKGGAGSSDILLDPSGSGKIRLNAAVVEANGFRVVTLDANGKVPISQITISAIDGGTPASSATDTIDGGIP